MVTTFWCYTCGCPSPIIQTGGIDTCSVCGCDPHDDYCFDYIEEEEEDEE